MPSPFLFAHLAAASWTAPASHHLAGAGAGCRVRPPVLTEATEATTPSTVDAAFKKRQLMEGLRREYESFFQPMEKELYAESVSFNDPLIELSGVDAYRNNVDMLAGVNALGKLCFSDTGLAMHACKELDGGNMIETRWTLQFRFNLLPWKPLAQFTGVSRYTLDGQSRVLRQQDYWDSVNLRPGANGGSYAEQPKLAAVRDLLGQLAPGNANQAQQASSKELPYVLLRRAAPRDGLPGYEIRRYPQHVSVKTSYFQRIDAFGTLGAYCNGANEDAEELKAYVPSLMSVPPDSRSMQQIRDDSLDLKQSENPKVMRWPMAVPALQDATPPQPSERMDNFCSLDLNPSRVVAVLRFSDPTTEPTVRGYHALLKKYLDADGLTAAEGEGNGDEGYQFRLAQFDALNSFGARRSEIWVDLDEGGHPWK